MVAVVSLTSGEEMLLTSSEGSHLTYLQLPIAERQICLKQLIKSKGVYRPKYTLAKI